MAIIVLTNFTLTHLSVQYPLHYGTVPLNKPSFQNTTFDGKLYNILLYSTVSKVNCLAKKGFKVITIRESGYSQVEDISKDLDKSMPETVIFLSDFYLKHHKAGDPS